VRQAAFAAPGDLGAPTGGDGYDRRIIAGLGALGWRVAYIGLDGAFPFPDAAARAGALRRLAAAPAGQPLVIDGLAFGALPEAAGRLAATHRLVALVHHPLALEYGLAADQIAALRASERQALGCAGRVIVTSSFTRRLVVEDYGVAADRIIVVQPGADRAAAAHGGAPSLPTMLAVGAVSPRKGYDLLVAACARLIDLPWRLIIVGDLERDRAATARLRGDIARFDLGRRITLTGVVAAERLEALYAGADLFVLASRFEGYGMAFAEAIAHGLPVVGVHAGAAPQTVAANARLLVPPEDPVALADALRRLLASAPKRRRLAQAARRAAAALPSWERAVALFSEAIERAP
jgi:glycosyltransferase involved in cell wall biosynthesis